MKKNVYAIIQPMSNKKEMPSNKRNSGTLYRFVIASSILLWLAALVLPVYTTQATVHYEASTIHGWQAFVFGPFAGLLFRPDILLAWSAHIPAFLALILITHYRYKLAIYMAFVAFLLSMITLLISTIGIDVTTPIVPTIGLIVWMGSIDMLLVGAILLHRQDASKRARLE